MIALTGPAAANVKLASHCVIRCHRFYSEMSISVGIEMCLILFPCSSLEQLLCNRMERCHRLNLEFVIWQFIDSSGLLRIAEAIWPEQMQDGSFLLCISVAAWRNTGSVSQGLEKGSHGTWLLTPCQLYSQPGAQIESQWGRKQDCKQGHLSAHQQQRPFLWHHLHKPYAHTQTCTHRFRGEEAALSPLQCFHVFVVRKKGSICTFAHFWLWAI